MIYFDYSATTPIDPRVLELMTEVHANAIGNPSSVHRFGQKARSTVERARRQISSAVGCDPTEIIFTGSGSEANNLVLRNLLYGKKQHVVLSSIEHPSIYNTVKELEPLGITNTVVDVDGAGRVNPDEVLNAIQEETGLVSIMMVNNEVGTVEPIADMANECKNRNIPFHSDGVQALGKIPLDVKELG
ncbi:MAG TPA: aminotransferase class V-fold PLP-dependent enzyme, partial [Candidatus Marinimicrobia bacterium]|nr:aminotransferase class V-fold PLP-dependent enzyme [Candidatus Neomarinimicrobiota bacterium]